VNVQGLVAAVANKVQTLEGRWLSIDGRVLFKAVVAASETYNTALEGHLRDLLGVRFAPGPAEAGGAGNRWGGPRVDGSLVGPPT
jgi:hypothetical protein